MKILMWCLCMGGGGEFGRSKGQRTKALRWKIIWLFFENWENLDVARTQGVRESCKWLRVRETGGAQNLKWLRVHNEEPGHYSWYNGKPIGWVEAGGWRVLICILRRSPLKGIIRKLRAVSGPLQLSGTQWLWLGWRSCSRGEIRKAHLEVVLADL